MLLMSSQRQLASCQSFVRPSSQVTTYNASLVDVCKLYAVMHIPSNPYSICDLDKTNFVKGTVDQVSKNCKKWKQPLTWFLMVMEWLCHWSWAITMFNLPSVLPKWMCQYQMWMSECTLWMCYGSYSAYTPKFCLCLQWQFVWVFCRHLRKYMLFRTTCPRLTNMS